MTNRGRDHERSRFYNKVLIVIGLCLIALLAIIIASNNTKSSRYANESISDLEYLSSGYGEYVENNVRFAIYSYNAADDSSALDLVDRVKLLLEKEVSTMNSNKRGLRMVFGIIHNKGKTENGIKSYMFGCGDGAQDILIKAFPEYVQENGPIAFTQLMSREFDIVPAIREAMAKQ